MTKPIPPQTATGTSDEASLPRYDAVHEASLYDPGWRQHFDSTPLDQHIEDLRLLWPLALIQRQDLPPRILISRTRLAAHIDIRQHEHMRDALALPPVPRRVRHRERVRESLARYEVQHDFVRVVPHGVSFAPIFAHVIGFPARQARGIHADQVDQYRRSFQRLIQTHFDTVLSDRARLAGFARTATREKCRQEQEHSSTNQSDQKPLLHNAKSGSRFCEATKRVRRVNLKLSPMSETS